MRKIRFVSYNNKLFPYLNITFDYLFIPTKWKYIVTGGVPLKRNQTISANQDNNFYQNTFSVISFGARAITRICREGKIEFKIECLAFSGVLEDWEKLSWEWCDQHVTNTGQRKELIQWPSVHRSDALTTDLRRTRGKLGHIQGSCITCALRTAKISNVEIVMCVLHKEWW